MSEGFILNERGFVGVAEEEGGLLGSAVLRTEDEVA